MNWPTKRVDSYTTPWNSGVLHRSIDDLLEDFFGGYGVEQKDNIIAPRFEVSETEDAVVVEAELPGMDEKDIELTVRNGVLTLKGEKRHETKAPQDEARVIERRYGSFQRSFTLPDTVDDEKADAKFDKGVLKVVMPKKPGQDSKDRKIKIGG